MKVTNSINKVNDRLNAHIWQNRQELNTQRQETLNVARELQNKLDSHKQKSHLAIATISQEAVQHKDYVDDKFNSVTGNIRKDITKITATLGEL